MKRVLVFILLIVSFFSFASADVISINSGGSTGLVINPDNYIEGFFLGSLCGDGACNSGAGETCSSCVADCACGSGFTCTAGVCVAVPGEGPGGGGGEVTPSEYIRVIPTSFSLKMLNGSTRTETLKIINEKTTGLSISISVQITDLGTLVNFRENDKQEWTKSFVINLSAKQEKTIDILFVASEIPGKTYKGKILVGSISVPFSIDVRDKLTLFDSNIVVLNKGYKVRRGDKLRTKVTLMPMGDKERMDVILNYKIQDYLGKVYLTQSESMLVEKKIDFKRNFDTGSLPLGDYIVGLELVYPGGVAPSSAHFEVVKKSPSQFLAGLMFYLIIFILIIAIIIIILIIKKKREEEKQGG